MRLTSLLGLAALLTLRVISATFAQEPAARQDVPATTGTIFQSQPSETDHGRSVIVVPGAPRTGIGTSAPASGGGSSPPAPSSRTSRDEAQ
jgi:hypothetical protein